MPSLADPEMIQFYPTGVQNGSTLITEAARGDGLGSYLLRYMRHLGKDTIMKKLPKIYHTNKLFQNIDCIDFCEEPALLITRALAPAIINSVKIEVIKPENTDFDANEALSAALKSSKNLGENAAENAENLGADGNSAENLNLKGENSAENSTTSTNLSENSAQNLNLKDKNSAAAENLGENLNLKSENSAKNSKEKAKSKTQEQPTKKAIVTLNVEQKSKAIGKNGINIRLASMLTGYEIELKELGEKVMSNEEAMKSLQSLFKE